MRSPGQAWLIHMWSSMAAPQMLRRPDVRRRRSVKARLAIGMAALGACLSSYVATWISLGYAADSGMISRDVAIAVRPLFEPLMQYCESGRPGGLQLAELYWKVNPVGGWRPVGMIIPVVGPLSPSPAQVRYAHGGNTPPGSNADGYHPDNRRAEFRRLWR